MPPVVASLTTADLETLAKMDLVVRGIRSSKPNGLRYPHELVAKSLAAMHTVATFSELPRETQHHPEVQRRMWAALPDVDDATMSMADHLDALTSEERRRVDERVRKDESLPMKIVEQIDAEAKRRGVPDAHRLKMRTIATHVAWRLKSQGAGSLIDDLVGKVDRVVARHGADTELQRAIGAKVAEAQLFGYPPGGQTEENPTAVPEEQPATGPMRARFRTAAPRDAIQRVTCALQARVVVDGRQRPIDLRVEQGGAETQCGFEGDSPIPGVVRLKRDADMWEVMLEVEPPEGITEAGRSELRQGLRDVGGELRRRMVALERSAPPPPVETSPNYDQPVEKKRSSAKVLTASAILWGIGFAVAGAGGIMVAAGGRDGGVVLVGAFFLTVASLLAVAGIVTLIIAGALYAGDN